MSSTSQALGPNEPPALPNWVMSQPYRRRSGLMGSPGSVCPAHELSGRPPLHYAAGLRSRGGHRRASSTDRSTGATASGWPCAGSPSSPRWPMTGGATRVPGTAGSSTSGGTSTTCSPSPTRRAGRRGPGGGHRAQPGGQRRARRRAGVAPGLRLRRGLRAAHAVAGLPPPGRGPVAGPVRRSRARRRSASSRGWSARARGTA